jgi:hypothetical protein
MLSAVGPGYASELMALQLGMLDANLVFDTIPPDKGLSVLSSFSSRRRARWRIFISSISIPSYNLSSRIAFQIGFSGFST